MLIRKLLVCCVVFWMEQAGATQPHTGVNAITQQQPSPAELKRQAGELERKIDAYTRKKLPDDLELADQLEALAWIELTRNNADRSIDLATRSLSIRKSSVEQGPRHARVGLTAYLISRAYLAKRDYIKSTSNSEIAIEILEQSEDYGPNSVDVGDLYQYQGALHLSFGFEGDALHNYWKALEIYRRSKRSGAETVATLAKFIAQFEFGRFNYDNAEKALRIAIDISGTGSAEKKSSLLSNLATVLHASGRFIEADQTFEDALNLSRDASNRAIILSNHGLLLSEMGHTTDGLALLNQAAHIQKSTPDTLTYGVTLNNIGQTHLADGNLIEAQKTLEAAITTLSVQGNIHDVSAAEINLAQTLLAMGELDKSEAFIRAVVTRYENAGLEDHLRMAQIQNVLAALLEADNRSAEAMQAHERGLELLMKHFPTTHPIIGRALVDLADRYGELGLDAKARDAADRAKAYPRDGSRILPIYFATTRAIEERQDQPIRFGRERGPLVFGKTTVLIPENNVVDQSLRRSAGDGALDRSRNALTTSDEFDVRPLKIDQTARDFIASMQSDNGAFNFSKDVLIFVHGFNVTFQNAVKSAAKIAYDLDYKGPVILFSWASAGKLREYDYDEESAILAEPAFAELINLLIYNRIHILAHSKGSSVVAGGLRVLAQQAARKPSVGEVILAHADLSVDDFVATIDATKTLGGHITAYCADNDLPLVASRMKNSGSRLGHDITAFEGADIVDVSALGRAFSLNHSTFVHNPTLFGDMSRLLVFGTRPVDKRTPLFKVQTTQKGPYWQYQRPRSVPVRGRPG